MRPPQKQNGQDVRSDFGEVGGARLAVKPCPPAVAVAFEFDDMCFAGDANLVLHGVRSSCSRRPSVVHREGSSLPEEAAAVWQSRQNMPQPPAPYSNSPRLQHPCRMTWQEASAAAHQ